ncbi:hypothetical protein [Paenibacillus sp. OV219]|nr:hypothetical protein [Paenibacillus sp. OV219]SEM86218.1 hypothetical protein SAMN05518847_101987 [Paenibacillus sp. OV219]
MTQEEVLTAGNVNHIVRIANTIHPTGYWSPYVLSFSNIRETRL